MVEDICIASTHLEWASAVMKNMAPQQSQHVYAANAVLANPWMKKNGWWFALHALKISLPCDNSSMSLSINGHHTWIQANNFIWTMPLYAGRKAITRDSHAGANHLAHTSILETKLNQLLLLVLTDPEAD